MTVLQEFKQMLENFIADLTHTKTRHVREIKFIKNDGNKLEVSCYDNQTTYGEYWITNLLLEDVIHDVLSKNGISLGVKYDATLFGIPTIALSNTSAKAPLVRNAILKPVRATLGV